MGLGIRTERSRRVHKTITYRLRLHKMLMDDLEAYGYSRDDASEKAMTRVCGMPFAALKRQIKERGGHVS